MNISWLKSIFSEADGMGSSSRVCITAIVFFVIGVGIGLIFKIHVPLSIADYCSFLNAAGLFIATTCSPLYLINKGADAINKKTAVNVPSSSSSNSTTGV